jgi:hypothetical protein
MGIAIAAGLAVSPAAVHAQQKMYWTVFTQNLRGVQRANLDGTDLEELVVLDQPGNRNGITLDPAAGKIYWTLCAGIIRRADLDGSAVEDVLTGLGCLVDIEIDSGSGKMYWTEATFGAPKIRRANLDGSAVEDLVTTGLDSPRELALAPGSGQMFWADSGTEKIQRAALDGTGTVDLVTGVAGLWGLALDLRPALVFSDGFESGDLSRWSVVVP